VVLGATGAQAEIPFPTRPLDLLSALGAVAGLRDFDADPQGVFVFRREPERVAETLLGGPPPEGLPPGPGRPVIYRLDMTQPESFFVARDFAMRDGDAVFVTNAPLTELRKVFSLFNTLVTPINSINTLPVN
jgi:polysaccharide export outer membrane protein